MIMNGTYCTLILALYKRSTNVKTSPDISVFRLTMEEFIPFRALRKEMSTRLYYISIMHHVVIGSVSITMIKVLYISISFFSKWNQIIYSL